MTVKGDGGEKVVVAKVYPVEKAVVCRVVTHQVFFMKQNKILKW